MSSADLSGASSCPAVELLMHSRLGVHREPAVRYDHLDQCAGISGGVPLEYRLHRLSDRHAVAVGREVVVGERTGGLETFRPLTGRAPKFDDGHFLEELAEDFDSVAAL